MFKFTFICSGLLAGLAGAAVFSFDYDVDGRLLEVRTAGDEVAYDPTPAHNFSGCMAMGDANTNNMPDSLEAWLAGHWPGEYNPFMVDSDFDGMCDFNEWTLGTNPFSYDSIFSTWPSGGSGGGTSGPIDFTVSWSSIPFRTYAVEHVPALGTTNWLVLDDGIEATPPVNSWIHEDTTNRCGFYRAVQVTNQVFEGGAE